MRRSPIQSHVAMESAPASLPNMSVEKGVLGSVYAMVGGEVRQQGEVGGRGGEIKWMGWQECKLTK